MTDEFYFGAAFLVVGVAFAWYMLADPGIRAWFKSSDRETTPAMRPPGVRYAGAVLGSVLVANIAAVQAWPGQSWYIAGAVAVLVIADVILWRQRRPEGRDAFFLIASGICLVAAILGIKDHPRQSLAVFVIATFVGLAIVAVKKRQRQDAPAQ
jgi:dolichyl-phosphate-mannose--protein O-mannosyl transferase